MAGMKAYSMMFTQGKEMLDEYSTIFKMGDAESTGPHREIRHLTGGNRFTLPNGLRQALGNLSQDVASRL